MGKLFGAASVPATWTQGVADLLAMPCPASCPEARWNVLREDSYTFLRDHAARAHELGWTAPDLFGVHRERPWVRFDCMSLMAVLNGASVMALANTEAVIEKPNGSRLTFRRRGQVPDETCLIFELPRRHSGCVARDRRRCSQPPGNPRGHYQKPSIC